MLSIDEVDRIAAPILRHALGPFGLRNVAFREQLDHDGDPIVVADVDYEPNAPKLDIHAYISAVSEAMRQLHAKGDPRFLHVQHHYADGLSIDDAPKRRRGTGN